MSNSTRHGGYDERFVVPPEASRRGAHRARVNPVLAVLPFVVVAALVAGVVALAYTFLSGSFGGNGGNDPAGSAVATATPTTTGGATATAGASPSASAEPSQEPSASPSATPSATVDKSVQLSIFNGTSPTINGHAAKAGAALKAEGWRFRKPETWSGPAITRTTVFYANARQEATAEAVVESLGVGVARRSASQARSGITVVVFNDWQP
jgi:hypothetical protein